MARPEQLWTKESNNYGFTNKEVKMYNQGRSQMTFVIQSRDNEQNAKLTFVKNAVLYHKLILQYRATLDEILPSSPKEKQ